MSDNLPVMVPHSNLIRYQKNTIKNICNVKMVLKYKNTMDME